VKDSERRWYFYPYEEDAASHLRTRYSTSKASEALLALDDIIVLAQEVLPDNACKEAEQLAKMLASTDRNKNAARDRLMQIVKPPPKRPLMYCQLEIPHLPYHTRDILRDLGDFIDMLVKSAAYEKTRKNSVFRSSLGLAINQFAKCYPDQEQLFDWLQRYNRFLYRDAKHDMKLPPGRKEHRFTSREVVLSIFVTMKLGEILTKLSPMAARVRSDKYMEDE